jgi:hypothetical protein
MIREENVIEAIIKIHDRYQFEIKLNYPFRKEEKEIEYDVENYFFIPTNLHIDSRSFSNDDFYHNAYTYIRFKTPEFPLHKLKNPAEEPFREIRKSLQKSPEDFEYYVKMYCSILKSAIRDFILKFPEEEPGKQSENARKFLETVQSIPHTYRRLPEESESLKENSYFSQIYRFGDEYISLALETYCFKFIEKIKTLSFPGKEQYCKKILTFIKTEIDYRARQNYPSIPKKESDNEEVIFRKSALKKYAESVLFLNTRFREGGRIIKHFAFALGAGLAMVFATVIAFATAKKYGNFTLPFFMAVVISYMFKDRIKELSKTYLGKTLKNHVFDHKLNIYREEKKKKIGILKETVQFLDEDKIADSIKKIRNRDIMTSIYNQEMKEDVLYHHKKIILYAKKMKDLSFPYSINGLNDIMRFNISRFVKKTDNPQKPLYIPSDGDYEKIMGEKVYHLNLVVRYRRGKSEEFYQRFRVVLNRDGIKRIEDVGTGI